MLLQHLMSQTSKLTFKLQVAHIVFVETLKVLLSDD